MNARTARLQQNNRTIRIEALETRQLFAASINDPGIFVRANEPSPVSVGIVGSSWPLWNSLPSLRFQEDSTSADGSYISSPTTATVKITSQPEHGTATISADGKSILYRPVAGYVGKDQLLFSVEDGVRILPEPEVHQLSIWVVGQSWVAVPDWTSVTSGSRVGLDVLKNDRLNAQFINLRDWSLALTSAVSSSGATVSISADGRSIEYLAKSNFTGVDVVTYSAKDQDGYTVEGKAEIRVVAPTDPKRGWPEQVRQAAIESAVNRNAAQFGRFNGWYNPYYFEPYYMYASFASLQADAGVASSAPDHVVVRGNQLDTLTGTNTQLANIDESDWVKSDGNFLYVLSNDIQYGNSFYSPWVYESPNSTLTVVDVRNPSSPVVVASQKLSGRAASMDLHNNRLTVFYFANATKVDVFDVSTPANLTLVSSSVYSGIFEFSRRVDDRLILFTYASAIPDLQWKNFDELAAGVDFSTQSYIPQQSSELGTEYLARLTKGIDSLLPSYTINGADGKLIKSGSLIEFEQNNLDKHLTDFYLARNIITLNTSANDGGLIDWDLAQGSSQVLVTTDAIYVAGNDWQSSATNLEKFDLNKSGVQFAASGRVDGWLRDSFSMGAFDGNLRIVVNAQAVLPTEDGGTENTQFTNLYVLSEADDQKLKIIGSLTGLAKGESVFSVRYAEQTAYVVTALSIDPLFVIDLSDPTRPVLKGELKVPGVSTYLEVIDENHLLSVGRGDLGWNSNAVSLFDISDPSSPKLVDREIVENSWSSPDYRSIQFLSEFNILAIPIINWGFDRSWDQSLFTFEVDVDKGIQVSRKIDFDSNVSRSLKIGDYLYALSDHQIKVISLADPGFETVTLDYSSRANTTVAIELPEPPFVPTQTSVPVTTISPMIKVDATAGVPMTVDIPWQGSITTSAKIKSASIQSGEGEIEIINDGTQIKFTPDRHARGSQFVKCVIETESGVSETFVEVKPTAWQWHNSSDQLDSNDDGFVTPSDALLTINLLNDHGSMSTKSLDQLYGDGAVNQIYYHDTNGDGYVTPVDALLVINRLNEDAEKRAIQQASGISQIVSSGEAAQQTFNDAWELEKKRRA